MIGIYEIISPSGRIYIGQSVDVYSRWEYYRRGHCKYQPKLYYSFNKYGWENHYKNIIEECSIEHLDEREIHWKQHYIDQLGWGKVLFCEIYDKGGGNKSETTRQKMSLAHKNKTKTPEHKNNISLGKKLFFLDENRSKYFREKVSKTHKGKKITETTKIKMSKANKGKIISQETRLKIGEKQRGRKLSEEAKLKIGKANKGSIKPKSKEACIKISNNLKKPIVQYDLKGKFIKEWDSAKDAGDALNVSSKDIKKPVSK